MTSRYSSHAIARLADLTLLPSRQRGLVRQEGPWLHLGPEASDDEIVTIACRHIDLREHLDVNEERVRERVSKFGYCYVPPTKTYPKTLHSVRSDRSTGPIRKVRAARR